MKPVNCATVWPLTRTSAQTASEKMEERSSEDESSSSRGSDTAEVPAEVVPAVGVPAVGVPAELGSPRRKPGWLVGIWLLIQDLYWDTSV